MYLLGFDIGGTKCAVNTAEWDGESITLLKKEVYPTDLSVAPEKMIARLIECADRLIDRRPDSVGISCGGPLDSERGVILGPPNLPGWDRVEIVKMISEHFGAPTHLENDANACAVAEWKFGAGRGSRNMVFLTFGTGLGAGLILNGQLYSGTNGNAGEVGHVRLADSGPVGFGKAGSFEGFCSGGGIGRLAYQVALDGVKNGIRPSYFTDGMTENDVTARAVADAARGGDPTALEVYRISGTYLGKGLAMLIDVLNPERIVIGSVFLRSGDLLADALWTVLKSEALGPSLDVCTVVPAGLGESIGDYAAIATALL